MSLSSAPTAERMIFLGLGKGALQVCLGHHLRIDSSLLGVMNRASEAKKRTATLSWPWPSAPQCFSPTSWQMPSACSGRASQVFEASSMRNKHLMILGRRSTNDSLGSTKTTTLVNFRVARHTWAPHGAHFQAHLGILVFQQQQHHLDEPAAQARSHLSMVLVDQAAQPEAKSRPFDHSHLLICFISMHFQYIFQ